MRPDGKRVKDLPPILAAIPYIMPKRYDAQNTITEYIDEELIKSYIREKRRTGIRINHMAVIIAAYYRAVMYNPKLNYFIMNSKVYKRNHFCVSFVIWLAYHLDKLGLLPRKIIDLSPFHTSMFITNLASIKTSYIHHHCYEFGTTSVFVCMGKPVPDYMSGNLNKKIMPLGVVMDERICTGYEYAAFCNDFRKFLRKPEELEVPYQAE